MFSQYINHSKPNLSLGVAQYGRRDCMPKFRVYHRKVQNYLIHYVYSGKGTYEAEGKVYNITKNKAFAAFPGQEIWYTADEKDPFSYAWVEFYGDKAFELMQSASLSIESPIFKDSEPYECGRILSEMTSGAPRSEFEATGMMWLFANALVRGGGKREEKTEAMFKNALSYIHANMDKPTTVEETAEHVGVTRAYLTKIFSKYISLTPKEYILRYHMNEVRALLMGTDMNIAEIADATGYKDGAALTKAFVRLYKMSPSEYRKKNRRADA